MRKQFILGIATLLLIGLPAKADWKPRKQLQRENTQLRERVAALEREIQQYRTAAQAYPDTLPSDNENLMSFEMTPDDYSTGSPNTDSLLTQWYMHRKGSSAAQREGNYNMDSIHFTSNVPDTVLMGRLSRMNSFIQLPYNETVKNYMILYSEKMPRKMGEILGLSQWYMPIFEETFRRYDLPLELKYMAIIESGLNPVAESWAGAKGMWQFMYRTAMNYGLQIDSYVDERLDPYKSADAAARYLRDAYRIFGDWALAISSYNCGSGNVNKAIRRAGGRTDFWSIYPYLPKETRGYVPAMVGAMYAMNYAREYGLTAEPISLPVYVDTFHIHRNLHLRQVSEVLGIPLGDMRDLNPQYHKEIVPGAQGDMILRLPYSYSGQFIDMQDSIYRYKANELFTAATVDDGRDRVAQQNPQRQQGGSGQWIYYTVRSGDNLGKIARKYHTTVAKLKQWNNLRSDRINVGQRLKVGKR